MCALRRPSVVTHCQWNALSTLLIVIYDALLLNINYMFFIRDFGKVRSAEERRGLGAQESTGA